MQILAYQKLSIKFLTEFHSNINDWYSVISYQQLNVEFIRKFIDNFSNTYLIEVLIKNQKLNEELIVDFKNYFLKKLDLIIDKQKIMFSKNFILKYGRYCSNSNVDTLFKKYLIGMIFDNYDINNIILSYCY